MTVCAATVYIGEIENRYLTGETRRKVIHGLYRLPMVRSNNKKVLLKDGEILSIDGIKIECILVPGHTWGHMVYLIDDEYLFTGDTIWFGADGGLLLIKEFASRVGLVKLVKKLFKTNDPASFRIHSDPDNLMQMIYQIIAAYFEDDCADELTTDPVFTAALEKEALASQPTLSRFWNRMDADTLA